MSLFRVNKAKLQDCTPYKMLFTPWIICLSSKFAWVLIQFAVPVPEPSFPSRTEAEMGRTRERDMVGIENW